MEPTVEFILAVTVLFGFFGIVAVVSNCEKSSFGESLANLILFVILLFILFVSLSVNYTQETAVAVQKFMSVVNNLK